MTIGTTNRNDAIGNDTTAVFPYGFKIFAAADLRVTVEETATGTQTTLSYPGHYGVSGVGASGGGNVTLASAGGAWQNSDDTLKTGYTITVRRIVTLLQATDVRNQEGHFPETYEDAFDYLMMAIQQVNDAASRALRLPETEAGTELLTTLPSVSQRAGLLLGFDVGTGAPMAVSAGLSTALVSAFMQTVLDDANEAAARATLGVTRSNLGPPQEHELGFGLINGHIVASVSANALTIAIKNAAGDDPSPTNPVSFVSKPVAATADAALDILQITAALSLTVSAGSTLGMTSGVAGRFWIVIFNHAGTLKLAIINCYDPVTQSIRGLADDTPTTATNEGGAGGADSALTFYAGSSIAASSRYRIVGYVEATQTAGNWSAVGNARVVLPGTPLPGTVLQRRRTQTGVVATGTTTIPADNTIPQNTEGDNYMGPTITVAVHNQLRIESVLYLANSAASGTMTVALFDAAGSADALASAVDFSSGAGRPMAIPLSHAMKCPTSGLVTFNLRAGLSAAGTTTFNGSGGTQLHGGVLASFVELTEIMT